VSSQPYQAKSNGQKYSLKQLALMNTEEVIQENNLTDIDEETKRDMVESSEKFLTEQYMLAEVNNDIAQGEVLQRRYQKDAKVRLLLTKRLNLLHQVKKRIIHLYSKDTESSGQVDSRVLIDKTTSRGDAGQTKDAVPSSLDECSREVPPIQSTSTGQNGTVGPSEQLKTDATPPRDMERMKENRNEGASKKKFYAGVITISIIVLVFAKYTLQ